MCGCETYECLEAFVNPCNVGTELDVQAEANGTWNAQILFNEKWTQFGFEVNAGENIVIPTSVLNENYLHELRLFNTTGVQTCYHLKTRYTSVLSGFEPQPPISSIWQWGKLAVNGNTVSDDLLGGDLSTIIWINEQPVDWAAQGITHTGDTLDFTAIGGAYGNIIFQYRSLPA